MHLPNADNELWEAMDARYPEGKVILQTADFRNGKKFRLYAVHPPSP